MSHLSLLADCQRPMTLSTTAGSCGEVRLSALHGRPPSLFGRWLASAWSTSFCRCALAPTPDVRRAAAPPIDRRRGDVDRRRHGPALASSASPCLPTKTKAPWWPMRTDGRRVIGTCRQRALDSIVHRVNTVARSDAILYAADPAAGLGGPAAGLGRPRVPLRLSPPRAPHRRGTGAGAGRTDGRLYPVIESRGSTTADRRALRRTGRAALAPPPGSPPSRRTTSS